MPKEELIKEVKRQLECTHGPMSTWSIDMRSAYVKLRTDIERSNANINKLLKPFGIKLML